MKEKILFVASVVMHLKHFHTPFIRYLKSQGYEIHTAALGENIIPEADHHFDIPFERSPYSSRNISAYKALKQLIDSNGYKLVHCHTPNASVIARLASRESRKKGLVVAYTAHGFHFYDGAPLRYALIYKNIERFMSRHTDYIITINQEDFSAVSRYKFACKKAFLTKGMGIDRSRFCPVSKERKLQLREKLNISENDFVIIYPAEYSPRKNHAMIFKAMAQLIGYCPGLLLLLPGDGPSRQEYGMLVQSLGLQDSVRFLGYQDHVEEYIAASDINVAPSRQEGLPTHVIESLSMGLPCIATNIRGQRDLIRDGVNGYIVALNDHEKLAEYISLLDNDRSLLHRLSTSAAKTAEEYDIKNTLAEHVAIYQEMLRCAK